MVSGRQRLDIGKLKQNTCWVSTMHERRGGKEMGWGRGRYEGNLVKVSPKAEGIWV